MLQNAYLLAKIGADTAENERIFAENLPTIGNSRDGRRPRAPPAAALRAAPVLPRLGAGPSIGFLLPGSPFAKHRGCGFLAFF